MGYQKRKVQIRWSAKFAYALGLLASDGCLINDGRHIDFTSNDIDQVRLFKKCLGLSAKIGLKRRRYDLRQTYYRIQFGDIYFYKWLLSIGFMPNKSKIIG